MQLLSLVKEFDFITIFRHQLADHDALGAQFAMKEFLQNVFPEKKIYAIGNSVGPGAKLYPPIQDVEDSIIENSVAIVLDSANSDRVDDLRFQKAKHIIKIDHHIEVDDYANDTLVDTKAAATCEILTFLFKETQIKMTPTCAKYLYFGLTADSLNFTTTNTSARTLLAASYLIEAGVNPSEVRKLTSGISYDEFAYMNAIRSSVKVEGKVAYSIMKAKDYQNYHLTYKEAKEKVFALADVNEFEVWCLFSEENDGDHVFNGSLRSKNVAINEVANKYRGGGHKNACGVKQLTLSEIELLVKDLNICCEEEK